jgi:hypothetical protein
MHDRTAGRPACCQHGDVDERIAAWARSGAMALTGRAGEPPLGPPARLIDRLAEFGALLRDLGGESLPEPLSLLPLRAVSLQLTRNGDISCGGTTRLVRARDGWIAVAMARADDVAAVPAWLELECDPTDTWKAIETVAANRSTADLVERARWLGLPVSALGEQARDETPVPRPFHALPVRVRGYGAADSTRTTPPLVIDLSSLWAGPLCTHLLYLAGMRVVKVESTARPDGARQGSPAFFDVLNAGKEELALDLRRDDGIQDLQRLIATADIVVEASRPRALQQLGIDADEHLASQTGPVAWISITGYGRDGKGADRVAFGDDAAVAGGLVAWDDRGPCFCADAIADPTTGIVAAAAALVAIGSGQRWLVDVAMSRVAADLAGPGVSPMTGEASPP